MTLRPARPRTLLDFINRPILKGVAPAGDLKRVFTGKSGQNRKKNFGRVMYASETIQNCKNPTGHIDTLKQYLLENCRGEIAPASDTTFQIGYYADGKKKYSISSEIQLAEALSLAKNGIITLWVDPHKDPPRVPPGKKRGKVLFTNAIKQATFCRT